MLCRVEILQAPAIFGTVVGSFCLSSTTCFLVVNPRYRGPNSVCAASWARSCWRQRSRLRSSCLRYRLMNGKEIWKDPLLTGSSLISACHFQAIHNHLMRNSYMLSNWRFSTQRRLVDLEMLLSMDKSCLRHWTKMSRPAGAQLPPVARASSSDHGRFNASGSMACRTLS